MTRKKRICLGAFAGAHGVHGEVKVKTFTEQGKNIAAYGPLESEDGKRRFTLRIIRELKGGQVLVRAPEIENREEAMALAGLKLFIDREQLPSPTEDDEYYFDDLVDLTAMTQTGSPAGIVAAVVNYGAGDLLELRNIPSIKGTHLIPFTKEAVRKVNLQEKTIIVSEVFLPEKPAKTTARPAKS